LNQIGAVTVRGDRTVSSFTKNLHIAQLKNKDLWRVDKRFEYHIGSEKSEEVVSVPEGFITDGASIPRAFWVLIGHPFAEYAQAAVIHDYMYNKRLYWRKRCDKIFLEAMAVLKVSWWKRHTMYRAVRLFGWVPWNKK